MLQIYSTFTILESNKDDRITWSKGHAEALMLRTLQKEIGKQIH